MKFINTSDVPDDALKMMVRWCAMFVELPIREIKVIIFKKLRGYNRGSSGTAYWSGRVVVRISPFRHGASYNWTFRRCGVLVKFQSREESIINTIAHELYHLTDTNRWSDGYPSEKRAYSEGRRAVLAFRANRARLLEQWGLAACGDNEPRKEQPWK